MAKRKAITDYIQQAGPLVTLTAGVDGIVELRELDVQDPPPLYAPGAPALDLFHRCLLPAIKAFDEALAKAYREANPSELSKSLSPQPPTVNAFQAKGVRYRTKRRRCS